VVVLSSWDVLAEVERQAESMLWVEGGRGSCERTLAGFVEQLVLHFLVIAETVAFVLSIRHD